MSCACSSLLLCIPLCKFEIGKWSYYYQEHARAAIATIFSWRYALHFRPTKYKVRQRLTYYTPTQILQWSISYNPSATGMSSSDHLDSATIPTTDGERTPVGTETPGPSKPPSILLTDQTNLLPFRKVIVVFSSLSLCILVSTLDSTIVATALPSVAADFNAGSIISWVPSAYLLTSTAFQPLCKPSVMPISSPKMLMLPKMAVLVIFSEGRPPFAWLWASLCWAPC